MTVVFSPLHHAFHYLFTHSLAERLTPGRKIKGWNSTNKELQAGATRRHYANIMRCSSYFTRNGNKTRPPQHVPTSHKHLNHSYGVEVDPAWRRKFGKMWRQQRGTFLWLHLIGNKTEVEMASGFHARNDGPAPVNTLRTSSALELSIMNR